MCAWCACTYAYVYIYIMLIIYNVLLYFTYLLSSIILNLGPLYPVAEFGAPSSLEPSSGLFLRLSFCHVCHCQVTWQGWKPRWLKQFEDDPMEYLLEKPQSIIIFIKFNYHWYISQMTSLFLRPFSSWKSPHITILQLEQPTGGL